MLHTTTTTKYITTKKDLSIRRRRRRCCLFGLNVFILLIITWLVVCSTNLKCLLTAMVLSLLRDDSSLRELSSGEGAPPPPTPSPRESSWAFSQFSGLLITSSSVVRLTLSLIEECEKRWTVWESATTRDYPRAQDNMLGQVRGRHDKTSSIDHRHSSYFGVKRTQEGSTHTHTLSLEMSINTLTLISPPNLSLSFHLFPFSFSISDHRRNVRMAETIIYYRST